MIKNLLKLLCFLFAIESWAGTNVYRWVDEHGVVTYGDRPTPSAQALTPGKSIFPKESTTNNPSLKLNKPRAAAPSNTIAPEASYTVADLRPDQQRTGGIDTKTGVQLTYYADNAMNVDREQMLKTMLLSRYSGKVKDTILFIDKFSVVEGNMRNSFTRDATGKPIPSSSKSEKMLIAEVSIHIDENYFNGYSELKLGNSRTTHDAIQRITIDAINDLANNMSGEWRESNSDHSSYSF